MSQRICAALLGLLALLLAATHFPVTNSDMLYPVSVLLDLRRGLGHLAGWYISPAPYFVPDLALSVPLMALTPDPGLGLALYEVLMLAALAGLTLWIARLTAPRSSSARTLAVTGAAAMTLLLLFEPKLRVSVSLCLLHPVFHGGAFVIGVVWIALVLSALRADGARRFASSCAWLGLAAALGLASDVVLLPWFAAPLAASLGLAAWLRVVDRGRALRIVVTLTLGAACGLAIDAAVHASGLFIIGAGINHVLARNPFSSLARFLRDVPFLARTLAPFWLAGVAWLLATVAAGVLAVRRTGSLRRVPAAWLVLSATIAFSAVISIAAAVLNGRYDDPSLIRHFLPTLLLPSLFLFSPAWLSRADGHGLEPRPLAALVTAGLLAAIFLRHRDWTPAALELPYPAYVRCIDDLAAREGLSKGLGDYWSARYVRVLSRAGVVVDQIDPAPAPFDWCNNPRWYDEGEASVEGHRFVITEGLRREALIDRFGAPAKTAICDGREVLVYDHRLPNLRTLPPVARAGGEQMRR
jgi:hypothetical protein